MPSTYLQGHIHKANFRSVKKSMVMTEAHIVNVSDSYIVNEEENNQPGK